MSRIGIDVRMIQNFPTGVGNYLENLIKALAKLPSRHQFVLIGNCGNKMEDWVRNQTRFDFVAVRSRANSIHQHFLLPLEISRLNLDLFWTTPWGASLFLPGKYALTIYDLLYRRYPEIASLKAKLYEALISKWTAKRAAAIFTISEFVKNDIVSFLGVKKEKVFNIKGAAAEAYKPINDKDMKSRVLYRYGITRPFFVYLGNFRPHKNLETLLRAFAKLKSQNSPFDKLKVTPSEVEGSNLKKRFARSLREGTAKSLKLVMIGGVDAKGRGEDSHNLLKILKELKLQNDVILTGRISDDKEVAAILNEAVALVHPSFHEGFGLTVLEAMSCGIPLIAANTTSIPEVVGGAGILVDPQSVDEFAEAMKSLYYNYTTKSPEYQALQRKSLEQAREFRWEKTAEQVLRVFDGYWH